MTNPVVLPEIESPKCDCGFYCLKCCPVQKSDLNNSERIKYERAESVIRRQLSKVTNEELCDSINAAHLHWKLSHTDDPKQWEMEAKYCETLMTLYRDMTQIHHVQIRDNELRDPETIKEFEKALKIRRERVGEKKQKKSATLNPESETKKEPKEIKDKKIRKYQSDSAVEKSIMSALILTTDHPEWLNGVYTNLLANHEKPLVEAIARKMGFKILSDGIKI